MNDLSEYFSWKNDNESGFRKLIIKNFESPRTELDSFQLYDGDIKLCPRCKRNLPKNTYFFASGGKRYDSLHGICKECEGTSFGWGRNKNTELQKMGKKYCKTCDRILPLNEIYFQKSSGKCNQKTGYSSNCKECNRSQFGIHSLNSLGEIIGIKENHKVCSQCMLELPDTDDYFYKKSDREYGQTKCKKCVAKRDGKEFTGLRHLNMSKSHLLKDDEKFCTSCGDIFKKDDISRHNKMCLCDKCYKDRNKYHFQKRKTRKNNLLADLTQNEWEETLSYFDHRCAYCGITEEDCYSKYHKFLAQEHVIALTKGGCFTKNNIIPTCPICNSSKGNMSLNDFFKKSSKFTSEMYEKIKIFIKKYTTKIS